MFAGHGIEGQIKIKVEIKMSIKSLLKFRLEIFGRNFDARSFCDEVNVSGSRVKIIKQSLNTAIPSIRSGDVNAWESRTCIYQKPDISFDLYPFTHVCEEEAMIAFLKSLHSIRAPLQKYLDESFETVFFATYGFDEGDSPRGRYHTSKFLSSLSYFNASLSTEVEYNELFEAYLLKIDPVTGRV